MISNWRKTNETELLIIMITKGKQYQVSQSVSIDFLKNINCKYIN